MEFLKPPLLKFYSQEESFCHCCLFFLYFNKIPSSVVIPCVKKKINNNGCHTVQ